MTNKVLIVDDEENIVISLKFLMEKAGYQVASAEDGAAAAELVESFQPDVVLLDVMLPQLSGYEVLRRIRQSEESESISVIMLTARGREAEAAKGLALGADRYVTKPFSTRDLVREVQELLGDE